MPDFPSEKKRGPLRLQFLTTVFLLLFTLAVRQFWPEGTRMLREFLIPGEPTVTQAAFSEMVTEIQAGEPLGDAVTAFCRQIVEDGTREAS